MNYPKIQNIFERDKTTHRLIPGKLKVPSWSNIVKWSFTEKVGGMNIRVKWDGKSIQFAGRHSDNAQIPIPLRRVLENRFNHIKGFLELFQEKTVTLFGEGFGGKIRKAGATYGPTQDFILFDVNVNEHWLKREDVLEISKYLGVPVVPSLGTGTLNDGLEKVQAGLTSHWGNFEAEGIIARPVGGFLDRWGNRIIVKIKAKEFETQWEKQNER